MRRGTRRVRTPVVIQMEVTECGAACLGTIMAYYGCIVPLERLRIDCGISRDGSKAANILKAARRYGFEASGRAIPDVKRLEQGRLPCIIHWKFNHFVVLEGSGKDRVFLNDPASGRRSVSREEFDESYTGIALYLEPGKEFKKMGEPPRIYRALFRRLHQSWAELIFVLLVGFLLVIPGLVIPAFTRTFIDEILLGKQRLWINPILWGLGLTVCLQGFLVWLQQYHLLRLELKLAVSMSGQFLWHVLRLPHTFFSQRFSGEIGSRVMLNSNLARMLSGELATNVINLLMMVFYLTVMLYYDVALTGIGVFFAVVNLLLLQYMARQRVDINCRLQMDTGKLTAVSMAGVRIIETLKASGTESDFFSRWSGNFTSVENSEMELAWPSQMLSAIPTFLNALNTAAILSLGAQRVMEGRLTIGSLIAFQTLMAAFMQPVNGLLQMGARLQDIRSDIDRIDDVLRYDIDPSWQGSGGGQAIEAPPVPSVPKEKEKEAEFGFSQPTGISIHPPLKCSAGEREPHGWVEGKNRLAGYLELRDVTFGYSPLDPPLIENFCLRVTPGMRVALVGASGSGKSTLSRLIAGMYSPWSGKVLFDGFPREEIPAEVLNNSLAVVDQEIILFQGTQRENITLWDTSLSDAQMLQAARDACIHDTIAARPGGYDNRLDECGTNFSGGEQQRLEIARALAVNPRILVLDEATSALDTVTELRVDRHIRRRGCTCVVIAHRLSTIRDCDEIIVLDRGKVAERGTHDSLVALKGIYTKLIEN